MGVLSSYIQAQRGAVDQYKDRVEMEAAMKLMLIRRFLENPEQYLIDSAKKWPPIEDAKAYNPTDMLKTWK